MIIYADELQFKTKSITGFEAYVFTTTEKHMSRFSEEGLKEMSICLFSGNGHQNFKKISDVSKRSALVKEFNTRLKDQGINVLSDSDKLRMIYIYLEGEKDYYLLMKHIGDFCEKKNRNAVMSLHYEQLNPNGTDYNPPHVHIIYNNKEEQELINYLLKQDIEIISVYEAEKMINEQ